jgi:hypothetical protein
MKDRMVDPPTLILTLIGAVGSYYEACKPFYTRKSISEVMVGVLEKLKLDNYLLESKILDEIISNPARPLIKILSYQLGWRLNANTDVLAKMKSKKSYQKSYTKNF